MIIVQKLNGKERNSMLIIGSTAVKHWYPDFKRELKDLDIIYKGETKPDVQINFNNQNLKIELLRNDILFEYLALQM